LDLKGSDINSSIGGLISDNNIDGSCDINSSVNSREEMKWIKKMRKKEKKKINLFNLFIVLLYFNDYDFLFLYFVAIWSFLL
jgi:hypothetical protein